MAHSAQISSSSGEKQARTGLRESRRPARIPRFPPPAESSLSAAVTDTYQILRPPVRITCNPQVPRAVAERWIVEHADWFSAPRPQPHIAQLALETGDAFIKTEQLSLGRSLRYALSRRPARAGRAFRYGLALARELVPAPLPLALIEHRPQGLVRRSYLVLETVTGDMLHEFLQTQTAPAGPAAGVEPATLKAALWRALARGVAALHGAGFRQRDLKAPNILVNTDGERVTVHLVDLEGMNRLQQRPPPRRVRIRDLARLVVSLRQLTAPEKGGVTQADLIFLITEYLECAAGKPPRPDEVADFLTQCEHWARRKEKRNRRRRRPLS